MKDKIKSKAISVKNHVNRNRGKYSALATATVFAGIQMTAAKQWTAFLIEKGIDPMEFFNPERFSELN